MGRTTRSCSSTSTSSSSLSSLMSAPTAAAAPPDVSPRRSLRALARVSTGDPRADDMRPDSATEPPATTDGASGTQVPPSDDARPVACVAAAPGTSRVAAGLVPLPVPGTSIVPRISAKLSSHTSTPSAARLGWAASDDRSPTVAPGCSLGRGGRGEGSALPATRGDAAAGSSSLSLLPAPPVSWPPPSTQSVFGWRGGSWRRCDGDRGFVAARSMPP